MDEIRQALDKFFKLANRVTRISDLAAERCILIAKVRQFSNESIHRPGEEVPFDCSLKSEWFDDEELPLRLYANGINNESKGYVSLRLRVRFYPFLPLNEYSEFSCIVSVIDSSGNKRFFRSFTFPYCPEWRTDSGSQTFDIKRYIKRETLLGEHLDLLPEDSLSLHIDATLKEIGLGNMSHISVDIDVGLKLEISREEKYYLRIDSAVGRRLKEVSSYFQRMSESAMKEKRTRDMNVPADEYKPFRLICEIVLGSESIIVDSIHQICLMYIVADKYDIPVAIEICRRLMTSFLREINDENIVEHVGESIPEMLELAERFHDVRLKEILQKFLKYEDSIEKSNRSHEDQQDNLETEWKVRILADSPSPYTRDKLSSFNLWKDVKWQQDKPEFEFYQ